MTLEYAGEPGAPSKDGGTRLRRGQRRGLSVLHERRAGSALSALAIALFAIFWVLPLIATVVLSFTKYDLANPPEFVGLANYERLLTSESFWASLRVTLVFTVLAVIPTLALALLVALPLTKPSRYVGFMRALLFIPAVMPLVASALVFQVMYQSGGVADRIVGLFGIPEQPWLNSPDLALYSILIMVIWKYLGLYVIIFIAGLQGIPRNLYEAAALDGARGLRTFIFITIPQLRRTLLFTIVIGVTGAVQSFVPVYLLTKGGPIDSTMVLPMYLFNNAFSYSKFGYASAVAVVLLLLLLAFAFLQFKLVDEPED